MSNRTEISDALREATQRFLSKSNIRSIAAKTGYSYSYVKAVQLQTRYNETIENELIIAIQSEIYSQNFVKISNSTDVHKSQR